jgi:hypothetical protein
MTPPLVTSDLLGQIQALDTKLAVTSDLFQDTGLEEGEVVFISKQFKNLPAVCI